MFSHRFHFLMRYSPTDFTDLHRTFLLRKILWILWILWEVYAP